MSPAAHRLATRAVRHRQRLRRYWRRLYPELLPWQVDVIEHSYFRGWVAVTVLERSYYRRLESRLDKVHTRFT